MNYWHCELQDVRRGHVQQEHYTAMGASAHHHCHQHSYNVQETHQTLSAEITAMLGYRSMSVHAMVGTPPRT